MIFFENILITLKKIGIILTSNEFVRVIIGTIIFILIGILGFTYFEQDLIKEFVKKNPNSYPFLEVVLWWIIVTMTTIGYGDIVPQTIGGKVVAIILVIGGIGFMTLLISTIAAETIERKSKGVQGLLKLNLKGHLVICGWNYKAKYIIEEILISDKEKKKNIVIIDDTLQYHPYEKAHQIHFVKGDPASDDVLDMANVKEADSVIILADVKEENSSDAKAALITLAMETLNPDIYTCVEIINPNNRVHFERAKADEIISVHEMSGNLLTSAVLNKGVSKIIRDLVSFRAGKNEIFKKEVPKNFYGHTFDDLLLALRKTKDILLAIDRKGEIHLNPQEEFVLKQGDLMVYISAN